MKIATRRKKRRKMVDGLRLSITIEESRAIITEKQSMGLNDEMILLNAYRSLSMGENKENTSEMYLARGLGVERVNIGFGFGGGGGGGGGGGEHKGRAGGSDGGSGVEEHYKRLVEENPRNPLFLRNYAQFLYESEKDMSMAEEYYSRAILVDPKDEVLSQYANVVWETHHDQYRASSYFERAVHAAPADSHVHAAYASFLWETEEGDKDANGLLFSTLTFPKWSLGFCKCIDTTSPAVVPERV